MLNLIKIETVNGTAAYVNPEQVVSIITGRQTGTRDNCVKIALVNGDYIETGWTYSKVIATLTQVVYDPTSDPDASLNSKKESLESDIEDLTNRVKNAAATFAKDSLVAKVRILLRNIKGCEGAIKIAQKLFDNKPSMRDVIIPLGCRFSAVVHIDEYCKLGGGYQEGIDMLIGPADHPFQGGCCARYGLPCLSDLDFTPHCSIADDWDPALLELLVRQLEAWADAIVTA